MYRFLALSIANANLALTHPFYGFSHFNAIFVAKSFMKELASRPRTPLIEVTKGVKDAFLASTAASISFPSHSQLIMIGEQNQHK